MVFKEKFKFNLELVGNQLFMEYIFDHWDTFNQEQQQMVFERVLDAKYSDSFLYAAILDESYSNIIPEEYKDRIESFAVMFELMK